MVSEIFFKPCKKCKEHEMTCRTQETKSGLITFFSYGSLKIEITVHVIYLKSLQDCEAPREDLQKMRTVRLVYLLFELWPFEH